MFALLMLHSAELAERAAAGWKNHKKAKQ